MPTSSREPLASSTSLWMPDVDLERLGGEVGEGGERSLPAERLHHQVGVDSADAGRVDLALGRRAQHAEVDALGGQPGLARGAGAGGLAQQVGALRAADRGSSRAPAPGRRRAPIERRRVALVAARRALAVALEERVSVSAPAPFGPPTQWHEGQEMVSGPPKSAGMDPTERSAPAPCAVTAAEAVGEVVLVLEEQLAEIGQLGQADLPGGHALRVERGVHLAQEGARAPRPHAGAARAGARPGAAPRAPPPG